MALAPVALANDHGCFGNGLSTKVYHQARKNGKVGHVASFLRVSKTCSGTNQSASQDRIFGRFRHIRSGSRCIPRYKAPNDVHPGMKVTIPSSEHREITDQRISFRTRIWRKRTGCICFGKDSVFSFQFLRRSIAKCSQDASVPAPLHRADAVKECLQDLVYDKPARGKSPRNRFFYWEETRAAGDRRGCKSVLPNE